MSVCLSVCLYFCLSVGPRVYLKTTDAQTFANLWDRRLPLTALLWVFSQAINQREICRAPLYDTSRSANSSLSSRISIISPRLVVRVEQSTRCVCQWLHNNCLTKITRWSTECRFIQTTYRSYSKVKIIGQSSYVAEVVGATSSECF